ncbi:MAG: heavy-metal-associated domain-containing protein [Gemmataceae bacterium]
MRRTRLLFAALLVISAISCGRSKPQQTEQVKTGSGTKQPVLVVDNGPVELRGRWKSVDARRPILGEFLANIALAPEKSSPNTAVTLSFRKKLLNITDASGYGLVLEYKQLDDNRVELTQLIAAPLEIKPDQPPDLKDLPDKGPDLKDEPKDKGKDEEPKEPPRPEPKKVVKVLKMQLSASELVLSDDAGKAEKFRRLPTESASVKITSLALYGDECVGPLKQALGEVRGVSDLNIDRAQRTVTLKLKDREDRDDIREAIEKAGMHGTIEINGKPVGEFEPVGLSIGGKSPTVKEIVLKDIHACCPACKQAIMDLSRGGTVKFEGQGPTATVTITGTELDRNKIILDLWHAGFRIVNR